MKRKRYQLLLSTLLAAGLTVQSPMMALASDADMNNLESDALWAEDYEAVEAEAEDYAEEIYEEIETEDFVELEETEESEASEEMTEEEEASEEIDADEMEEEAIEEEDGFVGEASVLDADLSYQVKVSAVGDITEGYIVAPQMVTVENDEAERYGFSDLEGEYVTTLDALVKMHEIVFGDEFTAETAADYLMVSSADYITKIFGQSTGNLGFTVNGIVPNDGVEGDYGYGGLTVGQTAISENDDVFFFMYQDEYAMDYMGWFIDENGEKQSEFEVEAGAELSIGCEGYAYFGWYGLSPDLEDHRETIENAIIMSATENGCPDGEVYSEPTDEDGMTTLTFEEAGTYYIVMYTEDEYAEPIISPIATVTVTEAGLEGEGTEENPYILSTAEDLVFVSDQVNHNNESYAGCYFEMTDDITLPEGWEPIGIKACRFGGIIDGGEHLLTIPAGEKCLLGNTSGAKLNNLDIYGTQIASAGVLETYEVGVTLDCTNVTLKSGTQTLRSGFLGGYASGSNAINLTDCIVEEGVVIGYNKDQSNIGSFGGDFNGTISGCSSAATVYGVNYVGGICGNKGQSMGTYKMIDCSFTGIVEASGNYAGGISGGGYGGTGAERWGGIASAPNTGVATIIGCTVEADITGADYVGGILGAEAGVVQTWENASGAIKNNYFEGTVTATSGNYVGGIIGYFNGLDKFNDIADNIYDCGAGSGIKGIGFIKFIDTNCENPTEIDGVTYYNTENGKPANAPSGASKKGHNRTDDPLGVDAASLAKSVYIEVKASILGDYIHDSDAEGVIHTNRDHNLTEWVKEDLYYVSGDATVNDVYTEMAKRYGITFENESGNYIQSMTKDGVTLGEFTNGQNSGWMYTLNGEYPMYGVAEQAVADGDELVFVYTDNYMTEYEEREIVTIDLAIMGDSAHGESGGKHTLHDKNLTSWVEVSVKAEENSLVRDIIEKVANENGITIKNESGNYIQAMTKDGVTLEEFTNGQMSGWMYTLNGEYPMYGVAEQRISADDVLVFHYTDDYNREFLLDTPVITSADYAAGGVKIVWEKVNKAEGYRVFRKEGDGKWTRLGDTTSLSFIDKTGKTNKKYTYTVRCISEDGSRYTSEYDKTGKTVLYIPSGVITQLKPMAKGITVTWNKVDGVTGYYVYRKDGTGNYAVVANVKGASNVTYEDTKATVNGQKYTYAVRPYIGSNKGYYTAKETYFLTAPAISKATNSTSKSISVSWNKNAKATGYQVYYRTSGSDAKTVTISKNTTLSTVISSLKKGASYNVYVRSYVAVSGKNYYSAWSPVKTVKIEK